MSSAVLPIWGGRSVEERGQFKGPLEWSRKLSGNGLQSPTCAERVWMIPYTSLGVCRQVHARYWAYGHKQASPCRLAAPRI